MFIGHHLQKPSFHRGPVVLRVRVRVRVRARVDQGYKPTYFWCPPLRLRVQVMDPGSQVMDPG